MSAWLLPLGGKGVCSDFIMADSKEQEGYGGSSMGLIGTGLAQGRTGMCWASGGRATGTIGTGLAQGRTGICWASGGRATGAWLTEGVVLARFRLPRLVDCLLFLNLREMVDNSGIIHANKDMRQPCLNSLTRHVQFVR